MNWDSNSAIVDRGYDVHSSSATTSPSTYADTAALERLYLSLGDREGPFAGPSGRKALRARFATHGQQGARWLIARMESERSDDTLRPAAELLAHIADKRVWQIAADKLLDAAERADLRSYSETLLRALAAAATNSSDHVGSNVVRKLAAHQDAALRELTLRLAAALPSHDALLDLFDQDADPDVKDTLIEVREELNSRPQ